MTTLPPSQVGARASAIAAPEKRKTPGAARGSAQKLERETRRELPPDLLERPNQFALPAIRDGLNSVLDAGAWQPRAPRPAELSASEQRALTFLSTGVGKKLLAGRVLETADLKTSLARRLLSLTRKCQGAAP